MVSVRWLVGLSVRQSINEVFLKLGSHMVEVLDS
jgi:hypothetical protein